MVGENKLKYFFIFGIIIAYSCTQEAIEFDGFNQFEVRRFLQGDSSRQWTIASFPSTLLPCWESSRIIFTVEDSLTILSKSACTSDSFINETGQLYFTSVFNDPVDTVGFLFYPDTFRTETDTFFAFRDSLYFLLGAVTPNSVDLMSLSESKINMKLER